jgi:hypothetical protein
MGVGEAGKFGVGGRNHHDVARRLAEVHRLGAAVDHARLGRQQVHDFSAGKRRGDGRAVKAGLADDHKGAGARLAGVHGRSK